jgi:hypothetical protein
MEETTNKQTEYKPITIPIYYFFDEEDRIVIDEECMVEEFKEEILKRSQILNGRKESK